MVGGLTFATVTTGRGISGQTCGLATTGDVYCWGGIFTDSTAQEHPTPTPTPGGHTFSSLSLGWDHACALTTGGAAYCWGDNEVGQLGDGTTSYWWTPVPVVQ